MYNGIIIINKEAGFTSSDVVARLRGILHMRRIGHTGTLDPDAVGVLPVCLGNGTKLVEMIGDGQKEYRAIMRLGIITDTQDMSGKVLEEAPEDQVMALDKAQIFGAAAAFTGQIEQIPPMYSAVRINGKRLYELARAGKTIERKARPVTVYEIEVLSIELPLVSMRIRCSKGTYIRTLCEDIGRKLGVGGCMQHLTRTLAGGFTLDQALTLGEVEALSKEGEEAVQAHICPTESFFADAPVVTIREKSRAHLLNGNPVLLKETDCDDDMKKRIQDNEAASPGALVRMRDADGRFVAVYRYDPAGDRLMTVKMFLG